MIPTQIVITRFYEDDNCTLSRVEVFRKELVYSCYGLELPWKNNERRVSRVPANHYEASFHKSPRFGDVVKIHNVPDRSNILFHVGNWPKDSLGCILLGTDFSKQDSAVWSSRIAFDAFMDNVDEPMFVNILDEVS